MSFEQLQQFSNLDLIGGQNNLIVMKWLHTLGEASHQLCLKSSKPLQIRGQVLTPTAPLIELDRVLKMQRQMMQSNCAFPLTTLPNEFIVNKGASFLVSKMHQIVMQNSWFDILGINQHLDKSAIHSFLNQLWNEIRGYLISVEAESDVNKRKKLISDQAKENSRIVSRLLTQHTDISSTKLFYCFCAKGDTASLQVNELEKAIVKLKSKLIDQFQQLNQGNLFCIQWRIQRTLYGQYYLNMLVYHEQNHQLQLPHDQDLLSHSIDKEGQISVQLNLPNVSIHTLKLERDYFQGINLAEWKVIFNNMLYPLKYYYYQSKLIKLNFEYIIY